MSYLLSTADINIWPQPDQEPNAKYPANLDRTSGKFQKFAQF